MRRGYGRRIEVVRDQRRSRVLCGTSPDEGVRRASALRPAFHDAFASTV